MNPYFIGLGIAVVLLGLSHFEIVRSWLQLVVVLGTIYFLVQWAGNAYYWGGDFEKAFYRLFQPSCIIDVTKLFPVSFALLLITLSLYLSRPKCGTSKS